jgi:hypothetical protein
MLTGIDVGVTRVMPEMERPKGDLSVRCALLMIAGKHLDPGLKLLGPGGRKLADTKGKAGSA